MQKPDNANPYSATDMSHDREQIAPGEPPPVYRLFSPRVVAIASFLGSCVAGGIVMAINYQRLGRRGEAVAAVVGGALLLGATIAMLLVAPQAQSTPTPVVGLAQATLMYVIAQSLQGTLMENHLARGGAVQSGWLGAAIGGLTSLVLAFILIGIVSVLAILAGLDFPEFFS